MSDHDKKSVLANASEYRRPYAQPEIKRVDLALEETLAAGCKLDGVCADTFEANTFEAGS